MSIPAVQQHVRRYVQHRTVADELPGLPSSGFDGITELWFDDLDGVTAVFGDSTCLELTRPDEAEFLDLAGCQVLVTSEIVVHSGAYDQAQPVSSPDRRDC